MKGMKTSRDYIKDDLDLLEASTSFIKGDGYKEKILEDIEEFAGDGLTDYQKGLVREMAKCDYECGGCVDPYDESFKELLWEDEDLCDNMEEAQDYYQELADMGPAGFYEEFQDEFDWDPDFVAQYGDDFEEDDDYFEEEDLEESTKSNKKRVKESTDYHSYDLTMREEAEMDEAYEKWYAEEEDWVAAGGNPERKNDGGTYLFDAVAFKEGYLANHDDGATDDELEALACSYFDMMDGETTHHGSWCAGWRAISIHPENEKKEFDPYEDDDLGDLEDGPCGALADDENSAFYQGDYNYGGDSYDYDDYYESRKPKGKSLKEYNCKDDPDLPKIRGGEKFTNENDVYDLADKLIGDFDEDNGCYKLHGFDVFISTDVEGGVIAHVEVVKDGEVVNEFNAKNGMQFRYGLGLAAQYNGKESRKPKDKRIKESLIWASMNIGSNNPVIDGMEKAYYAWCDKSEQLERSSNPHNDLWLADAEAFKEGYRENHLDSYTEDELEELACSYFDQIDTDFSTHWAAWVAGWTAYPIHRGNIPYDPYNGQPYNKEDYRGFTESKKKNKKSIKEKRITSAKTPTEWFKLFNNIFLEIKDKFPNLGVSKDWDGKFPAKIFIDKLDLELQFDLNYNGGYYSGSMRTYFGKNAYDGDGEPLVAWNSGDYEEFEADVQDAIDYLTGVCESRGSKIGESKKKGKKSIKENASDMDVFIVTPDWDQYPCDEHGNPDGWDPREEAEYFTKLENAALACGMQTGFIPFSDGDAESGMCAPETDGTWQATPAMLRQFIEEYDLPIKVYEQGIDGEVGEEIFDYQSLAFDADPIEQDDEVRDMGEMYGAPRGASSEEALKFFESKKRIKEMNTGMACLVMKSPEGKIYSLTKRGTCEKKGDPLYGHECLIRQPVYVLTQKGDKEELSKAKKELDKKIKATTSSVDSLLKQGWKFAYATDKEVEDKYVPNKNI